MAVRVSTSKSNWLESDEIWLFCIESKVYKVQLRDCPTISVNVRIAHTSPVNKPMIRRRVLMSDDRLDMLPQTSPLLIMINSACNFKFDRDDLNSIFSVGVESWAVLVWSFTCITGACFTGIPDHGNAIDLPGMPVVNIQEIDCACTHGGSLHFGVNSSSTSTCSSNMNEESSDENDNTDSELYSATFAIKGSSYDEMYQKNFKTVQSAIRSKSSIVINLLPEKDNPKDTNAIRVVACIDNITYPLGYIGVKKIPKVTSAIRKAEIHSTHIKSITSWFIRNINARKLRGCIVVCKRGKWLQDSDTNMYNSEL